MSSSGPSPRKVNRVIAESDGCVDEKKDSNEKSQKALQEIHSCQNEIEDLYESELLNIYKVEQKYNKLQKPYFDQRNRIIEKIPNFWVTAMINHPQISLLIDEDEEDCLHFLTILEVEEFEDSKCGYQVKFYFDVNPFFDNDVLVKGFRLGSVGDLKSTSSEIRWKQEMDLSKKQKDVIQMRRKRGLQPKTFFSWFNDHGDPSEDDILKIIKSDLWLNPLQYYLSPDIEGDDEVEEEGSGESEGDDSVVVEEEEDEDDKTVAPARDAKGAEHDVREGQDEPDQ